jgi:hypothetical protein
MRSLFLVLSFLVAAPAQAVTFHLIGATLDTCTSRVFLPGDDFPPVPDPTPCNGVVGTSLDGSIEIIRAALTGVLERRWLTLWPDELPPLDGLTGLPILPRSDETFIANSALDVRLGFDWGPKADHFAGLHFDGTGNIDQWFIGTAQNLGAYSRETTSLRTSASGLDFSASGPPGQFVREPVGPSPVPLPATAWLLMVGALGMVGLRRFA